QRQGLHAGHALADARGPALPAALLRRRAARAGDGDRGVARGADALPAARPRLRPHRPQAAGGERVRRGRSAQHAVAVGSLLRELRTAVGLSVPCAEARFRLTAFTAGARRVPAAPRECRSSVPQWRGEGISAANTEKIAIASRSRRLTAPGRLRNWGIESPQHKGDSSWRTILPPSWNQPRRSRHGRRPGTAGPERRDRSRGEGLSRRASPARRPAAGSAWAFPRERLLGRRSSRSPAPADTA